jgi:glucose/arabinose dehydrogenase/PKD repeat protein
MLRKKILFLVLFAIPFSALAQDSNVLIFSKTEGFRHSSIDEGITAIQQLASANNFTTTATEDASQFTFDNLIQYDAVIFLSTTGDVLNNEQQTAFEQYIQSGGGFVGIHAASDTEYNWPWYGDLVGSYFDSHPPGTPTATIKVADKVHPSTSHLPSLWQRTDEWYNYQDNPRGDVHVLMTLDESTYSGGNMGTDHPIAWMHQFDGGRAWYTGGGHTEASFSEANFLDHILGGIQWATGEVNGNYEATVDDKYQVTILDDNPNNPMNIAVLPNRDVLYVERGGEIKYRDNETGVVSTAGTINVFDGFEDGLLGIVLDPDFETNSWIYLFYSPSSATEQRVSRFNFSNGEVDLSSEEILLTIPTQRDQCCHSGGDLEFDANGNLFITTGDNTNPFESDGFAPIDERSGRQPFDAQRTSGNTNDLRGKILRIHPEDNGTYTIPEGNLFTDQADGLPEIFVMGTRNPFRMAVSTTTNQLVWGDVGPDSRVNSGTRGPHGYDEFNRTTTSGNFGWPLCIADNIPYEEFNFSTNSSEGTFDCDNPVNDSPNNTGSVNLPPARPAWIYYPYGASSEFPELGNSDARTAIGGDFFIHDSSDTETGGFPEYYDNTLFVAEWTRNWIKEIRLDDDGNLLRINPFLESLSLNRPIDLHFGPDGALYVIEWGTGFNGGNPDARVLRIEYVENLGNRPPQAVAYASVTNGAIPLEVDFFGNLSSDPDNDDLSYSWDFDGDDSEDATTENASFTYTEAGTYTATLMTSDPDGETSVAQVQITAGNSAPEVTIVTPVNGGFYQAGDVIEFKVNVEDAEQGTIGDGIDCAEIETEPSIGHNDHSHGVGPASGCEGEFTTQSHGDGPDNVFYVFNAEFTDDGGPAESPITGKGSAILNRKIKQAEHAIELIDVQPETTGDFLGGGQNIGYINNNSALKFGPVNFQNIEFMTLRFASQSNTATVEARLDNLNGPLIGRVNTKATGAWQSYDFFTSALDSVDGTHDLYLVFKNNANTTGLGNVNWIEFHGQGVAKENPDSVKGLAAAYYPNNDFTGTPVIRKDPMIAWNWSSAGPHEDLPSNNFSVRWQGEIEAPSTGQYTLAVEKENGTANVWIDDEEFISPPTTSKSISFTAGEKKKIKVEYVHTTGLASMYLKWSGNNPRNVIHSDYLTADKEALTVSNEMENENSIPLDVQLSQNFPNPFNPTTNIEFSIPNSGKVKLQVFNLLGQMVQTIVDGNLSQGNHSATFNAENLSSGVYFYTLEFDGKVLSNKMVLMK